MEYKQFCRLAAKQFQNGTWDHTVPAVQMWAVKMAVQRYHRLQALEMKGV